MRTPCWIVFCRRQLPLLRRRRRPLSVPRSGFMLRSVRHLSSSRGRTTSFRAALSTNGANAKRFFHLSLSLHTHTRTHSHSLTRTHIHNHSLTYTHNHWLSHSRTLESTHRHILCRAFTFDIHILSLNNILTDFERWCSLHLFIQGLSVEGGAD